MRDNKGKLITVWVPGLHGAGGTTLASAVGIGLKYFSNKKVLIINKSGNWSYMERFIENDIDIKYTIDNLKIFNTELTVEHIYTFATQITENLYMLAASKLEKNITKEDDNFEEIFIDRCLEGFDIVIADVATGIREDNILYLKRANIIINVHTSNEIILDDLYYSNNFNEVQEFLRDSRSINVFNKLYEGWDTLTELRKLNKKYQLNNSFGVIFDGYVLEYCCRKRKFYSYLINEFESCNTIFPFQIKLICDYILNNFEFTEDGNSTQESSSLLNRIFSKFNKGKVMNFGSNR